MAEISKEKRTYFLILGAAFLFLLFEAYLCYERVGQAQFDRKVTEDRCRELKARLDELLEEKEYLDVYIKKLMDDAEFLEMEKRSKLGVAEKGEIVIRDEGAGTSRKR